MVFAFNREVIRKTRKRKGSNREKNREIIGKT